MEFSEKAKKMKQNILAFAANHCEFHYQGSYEFFNLGCGLIKLNRLEDAIAALNKSLGIYKENADAYYARGFAKHLTGQVNEAAIDFRECLRYKNTNDGNYTSIDMEYRLYNQIESVESFNFPHHINHKVEYSDLKHIDLQILYDRAEMEFKAKNYQNFVDFYAKITELTAKLHFEYHVDLANMNFALAEELKHSGLIYEAIFFAEKALETERENPHNTAYDTFIYNCRGEIQNNARI